MRIADAHRLDLSLHEADMELARQTLAAAVRRREALDVVLDRVLADGLRLQKRRLQKVQDETAVQVWTNGRK